MPSNHEFMMRSIIEIWDKSIFCYGGDISLVGYTGEQYQKLGFKNKRDFETDIFFNDFSFEHRIKGDNIGQGLTNEDKESLIEHASYLFGNITEDEKAMKFMLGLALHVNRYRYLKNRKEFSALEKMTIKSPKKHYPREERALEIRKTAKKLILLMGGEMISYGEITKNLKEIITNPINYMPMEINMKTTSIKDIRGFLSSLRINKMDEISNFISSIKKS